MIIKIIEGVDKTGKTTLAEKFKKQGYIYIHSEVPKFPYSEYMSVLDNMVIAGGKFVLDRFHLGEEVYGPVYRGRSGLSYVQFYNIEQRLLKYDTELILCTDSAENIDKRFEEDGEEYSQAKDIPILLRKFEEVFSASRLEKTKHIIKEMEYEVNL